MSSITNVGYRTVGASTPLPESKGKLLSKQLHHRFCATPSGSSPAAAVIISAKLGRLWNLMASLQVQ